MKTTPGFLLAALLAIGATPAALGTNVVINEIMYFPGSGNLGESYVELYNADTVVADLSGWAFTKGLQFSFPAHTVLAPGAYLVVAADASAFAARYPGVTNFLSGWVPPMGAHVILTDGAGNVVSEVHYSNDGDWAVRYLSAPMYAHQGWEWSAPFDGAGASLELINSGAAQLLCAKLGPECGAGRHPWPGQFHRPDQRRAFCHQRYPFPHRSPTHRRGDRQRPHHRRAHQWRAGDPLLPQRDYRHPAGFHRHADVRRWRP